jgi:cobalt-zinc-cadmium efflux system protein
MHDHSHHHHPGSVSRKLVVAAVATFAFVVVELAVGFYASSLALIGDSLHNLTDTVALLLAFVALRIERRPATTEKTYGYQRAGILAAFINSGVLVAFTVYIFIEAFARFRAPHPVDSRAMLITAAVAFILNTSITLALHREGRADVNIRSAVLHMLGDAVSSAGIIGAAILIRVTGSPRWDPVVSVAIGLLIIWSSWGILRETVNLLLEGTPSGIDLEAVTAAIAAIEGVIGVHHLHIWALGPARPAMSCHLMVGDVPLKTTDSLLERVTGMLEHDYRIAHATIQLEFAECAEDDPYCVPYTVASAGGREDPAPLKP